MKHLDTLLDELQHPVVQLLDLCKEDQDRAIVACLWDLLNEKSARLFEVLSEAYPDLSASNIIDHASTISEEICIPSKFYSSYDPDIDYVTLYQPLEHIINDRIEAYNKS